MLGIICLPLRDQIPEPIRDKTKVRDATKYVNKMKWEMGRTRSKDDSKNNRMMFLGQTCGHLKKPADVLM